MTNGSTSNQHETLKVKLIVLDTTLFAESPKYLERDELLALKDLGLLLCCTTDSSNSETLKILQNNQVADLFDFIIDPASFKKSRPSPEVYYRCCLNFGLSPKQVAIIDNDTNTAFSESANLSGCHYVPNVNSISLAMAAIEQINQRLESEPIVTGWLQSTQVVVSLIDDDLFLKDGYGYPGKFELMHYKV